LTAILSFIIVAEGSRARVFLAAQKNIKDWEGIFHDFRFGNKLRVNNQDNIKLMDINLLSPFL